MYDIFNSFVISSLSSFVKIVVLIFLILYLLVLFSICFFINLNLLRFTIKFLSKPKLPKKFKFLELPKFFKILGLKSIKQLLRYLKTKTYFRKRETPYAKLIRVTFSYTASLLYVLNLFSYVIILFPEYYYVSKNRDLGKQKISHIWEVLIYAKNTIRVLLSILPCNLNIITVEYIINFNKNFLIFVVQNNTLYNMKGANRIFKSTSRSPVRDTPRNFLKFDETGTYEDAVQRLNDAERNHMTNASKLNNLISSEVRSNTLKNHQVSSLHLFTDFELKYKTRIENELVFVCSKVCHAIESSGGVHNLKGFENTLLKIYKDIGDYRTLSTELGAALFLKSKKTESLAPNLMDTLNLDSLVRCVGFTASDILYSDSCLKSKNYGSSDELKIFSGKLVEGSYSPSGVPISDRAWHPTYGISGVPGEEIIKGYGFCSTSNKINFRDQPGKQEVMAPYTDYQYNMLKKNKNETINYKGGEYVYSNAKSYRSWSPSQIHPTLGEKTVKKATVIKNLEDRKSVERLETAYFEGDLTSSQLKAGNLTINPDWDRKTYERYKGDLIISAIKYTDSAAEDFEKSYSSVIDSVVDQSNSFVGSYSYNDKSTASSKDLLEKDIHRYRYNLSPIGKKVSQFCLNSLQVSRFDEPGNDTRFDKSTTDVPQDDN